MILIEDIDEANSVIRNIDIETFNIVSPQLSIMVEGAKFTPRFRAGLWDGLKRFYKLYNTDFVFSKGLAKYVEKKLRTNNIEVEYRQHIPLVNIPTWEEFIEFTNTLKLPFAPYDYQLLASYECIKDFRKVANMSTGSGKSCVIYIISKWMQSQELKVLIVVPTIMLTTQLHGDFKDYGMEDIDNVHLIGGDNKVKHFDKDITISTWQSLIGSPDLFSDISCLIIDEAHLSRGESYENIISPCSTGAVYRLGMSGTIPRNQVDKMSMLGTLGPVKKYITPRQLIDRGLATPVQVKCLYFNYPFDERKSMMTLKYPQEVDYLTNHAIRTTKIAQVATKITKDCNSIVLFDRVEHGEALAIEAVRLKFGMTATKKELQDITNPYKIFLVTGGTKAKFREDIRQMMEVENDIIMFGTSSILSTGVNIKNLQHLILASGGKSSITINQSIGRLLRLHVSKNMTTIWDIVDDLTVKKKSSQHNNYFYKHFLARLEIYAENEYEIIEKEIQL